MTHIDFTPHEPAFDDVIEITVDDPPPGGLLAASMIDPTGITWRSSGTIPESSTAPVEAMRWLWSMAPDPDTPPTEVPGPTAPTVVRIAIESGGAEVASAEMARHRVPHGVIRDELAEPGLVGVLYAPDRPAPGVILLGGAEGGIQEIHAALLARYGFAVLALGYYGLPGLPPVMADIPVETFTTAADWLLSHEAVSGERLGIFGGSKGGEAALLAASIDQRFGAVVSIAGSGVITNGIGQSVLDGDFLDIVGAETPCFTRGGEALPFVPNVVTDEVRTAVANGEPLALRSVFEPSLLLDSRVADATIAVENIDGPILLVSSTDDAGYGPAFHEIAIERLHGNGLDAEHVIHEGAGHGIIAPPWAPTTPRVFPGPGVAFLAGGTAYADARARWDNWERVIAFFGAALADGRGGATP